MENKTLIVIVGPTAVGKTQVSVEVAKHFNCPIVNADSRQVFKEMSIGTARPSISEMGVVDHYFVGDRSITEEFSAGHFEKEGLQLLQNLFSTYDLVILSGGSGFYIDALCFGMDEIPVVSEKLRNSLNSRYQKEGIDQLYIELKQHDPEYASQVDQKNPQRIIRALEVCLSGNKPFSFYRKNMNVDRPFKMIFVGLEMEKQGLYQVINDRMDRMINAGLFDEASSLVAYRYKNALQTVGYSEIFDYLDGKNSKKETIRLLKQNTRRYAKRQLTWFKRNKKLSWFHPDEQDAIIEHINLKLHT